jgi:hypothetical protein
MVLILSPILLVLQMQTAFDSFFFAKRTAGGNERERTINVHKERERERERERKSVQVCVTRLEKRRRERHDTKQGESISHKKTKTTKNHDTRVFSLINRQFDDSFREDLETHSESK